MWPQLGVTGQKTGGTSWAAQQADTKNRARLGRGAVLEPHERGGVQQQEEKGAPLSVARHKGRRGTLARSIEERGLPKSLGEGGAARTDIQALQVSGKAAIAVPGGRLDQGVDLSCRARGSEGGP